MGGIQFLGVGKMIEPKPQLHLRIENCSILWITLDFISEWRTNYSSLSLQIENVEDVVQEEKINIQNPKPTFSLTSDLICKSKISRYYHKQGNDYFIIRILGKSFRVDIFRRMA